MTAIVGRFNKTGYSILSGTLEVSLSSNNVLVDNITNTTTLHFSKPEKFIIVNGLVNFELPESETQGLDYYFVIKDELGEVVYEFYAQVPNTISIDFSQLIPIGISSSTLDTSLRRLKRLIQSDNDFLDSITLVNHKGVYQPNLIYRKGDAASLNGSSYIYINENAVAGITPTNTNYWRLLVAKGDTGSGTKGSNTPYNPLTYLNNLEAVSMNQFTRVIETKANKLDLTSKAPLLNPSFDGLVTAPTPNNSDNSNRVITTAYAKTNLAPLINPAFLGTVTCPILPPSDESNRVVNSKFVKDSRQIKQIVYGSTNIQVDNSTGTRVDTGLSVAFTPKSATSLVMVMVNQAGCVVFNGVGGLNWIELDLYRNDISAGNFSHPAGYAVGNVSTIALGTMSFTRMFLGLGTSPMIFSTKFATGRAAANVGSVRCQSSGRAISTITVFEFDNL